MVFKPVQLYFAETFQCCFSSLEPSKSPALHCANIEVVNCEDLKNTLKEYFPNGYLLCGLAWPLICVLL